MLLRVLCSVCPCRTGGNTRAHRSIHTEDNNRCYSNPIPMAVGYHSIRILLLKRLIRHRERCEGYVM